jgi:phosphonate metabolism protein PhnN/1,5-bisphosphokinase (PRPP-forming)
VSKDGWVKMLVLVVGPSGAGKDTLLDAVRERLAGHEGVRFARREITRSPTPGGEEHIPVEPDAFRLRRDSGYYALSWEAHGLSYGIASDILADIARGVVVVASVSRAVLPEAARRFEVRVIEITAPPEILANRLASRGREGADDIAKRLQRKMVLPANIACTTVMNDSTIASGADRLQAAILA